MIERFKAFIVEQGLFTANQRILLAVSGGVDSVVMAELFHQAGYLFGIAHCNFQLRGEESEEDARFVNNLANRFRVSFFSKKFFTEEYANLHKISIQMAARELRYKWFEEVRSGEGFTWISTAHHQDDQIETFFINLLRGTGISGLHGIPLKTGSIIRPLLFASRKDIERYARERFLQSREDSSNKSTKYIRNKIRHQLLPLLQSIQPDFSGAIVSTIERIREAESILKPYIEKSRKKLIRKYPGRWVISIPEILKKEPLHAWLYELLLPFEFNPSTLEDLIQSLGQESGKTFLSPSFRMVKDRDTLIITEKPAQKKKEQVEVYTVKPGVKSIRKPIRLTFTTFPKIPGFHLNTSPHTGTFDKTKLSFPLTLRKWKPGDYFYPFGLNKRKKLSDFFIDEKIPIPDKEQIWLLCSGHRIAWVIGHRTDHRFRVSSRTRELLEVVYLPA